jgi:hypothetical protein
MNVREFIATAVRELEAVLRDDRSARIAALTGLAVLVSLSLLTIVLVRVKSRQRARVTAAVPAGPMADAFGDLGDWGPGRGGTRRAGPDAPDHSWPIDRGMPRRLAGTFAMALTVALALWLAGLALAPNIPAFLASREWHFQPFYIATHIIVVRLFVMVYTRGFTRGVAHLDVPDGQVRTLVDLVLGMPGALVALLLALPFVTLDFLYLFSDRYQRLGGPDTVLAIDYLMWGIWSVEWFLNAFIWEVLVGFLIKTWWVVRRHPFRSPIEIVLHAKHYKPFLQMSAEGASIVLAFTFVTVAYIWYTGGELTDYFGLCITAVLLVVSFVPSWLLLKAKVRRAVEAETTAMRRRLLRNLELAETEASADVVDGRERASGDLRSLEHRLDAAVAILRISYLEGRHQSLGASEARAVLVRMLAPAASIGWQVARTQGALLADLQAYLAKLF